jgi:hypothetical protein
MVLAELVKAMLARGVRQGHIMQRLITVVGTTLIVVIGLDGTLLVRIPVALPIILVEEHHQVIMVQQAGVMPRVVQLVPGEITQDVTLVVVLAVAVAVTEAMVAGGQLERLLLQQTLTQQ